MINWQPISTMPFNSRVLLFFEHGEKGNGEIMPAIVYPKEHGDDYEKHRNGPWYYWTWGGPNSGSDFEKEDDEKPVMWTDAELLAGEAMGAFTAMTDRPLRVAKSLDKVEARELLAVELAKAGLGGRFCKAVRSENLDDKIDDELTRMVLRAAIAALMSR